jgi:hypothetical protein
VMKFTQIGCSQLPPRYDAFLWAFRSRLVINPDPWFKRGFP